MLSLLKLASKQWEHFALNMDGWIKDGTDDETFNACREQAALINRATINAERIQEDLDHG